MNTLKRMSHVLMRTSRYCGAVYLLMGACLVPVVAANEFSYLPDPTKPPAGFGPASNGPQGANAQQQATAGNGTLLDANAAASGQAAQQALTLVRIDVRTGQGMAILNGRTVRVGDRIGEARVSAINATGIELQTPKGTRKYSLWENTSVADLMTDAASQDGGKDKP